MYATQLLHDRAQTAITGCRHTWWIPVSTEYRSIWSASSCYFAIDMEHCSRSVADSVVWTLSVTVTGNFMYKIFTYGSGDESWADVVMSVPRCNDSDRLEWCGHSKLHTPFKCSQFVLCPSPPPGLELQVWSMCLNKSLPFVLHTSCASNYQMCSTHVQEYATTIWVPSLFPESSSSSSLLGKLQTVFLVGRPRLSIPSAPSHVCTSVCAATLHLILSCNALKSFYSDSACGTVDGVKTGWLCITALVMLNLYLRSWHTDQCVRPCAKQRL